MNIYIKLFLIALLNQPWMIYSQMPDRDYKILKPYMVENDALKDRLIFALTIIFILICTTIYFYLKSRKKANHQTYNLANEYSKESIKLDSVAVRNDIDVRDLNVKIQQFESERNVLINENDRLKTTINTLSKNDVDINRLYIDIENLKKNIQDKDRLIIEKEILYESALEEYKRYKEVVSLHLGIDKDSGIDHVDKEFREIESTISRYKQLSNKKNKIDNWIQLMSEAKTEIVLRDLLDFAKRSTKTHLISEIVQISSRWNNLKIKSNQNLVSEEIMFLETGKINNSLIQILNEIEKDEDINQRTMH